MNLGAICGGCGHNAGHHAAQRQQDLRLASTKGQYSIECNGAYTNALGQHHCHCTASREEVMA